MKKNNVVACCILLICWVSILPFLGHAQLSTANVPSLQDLGQMLRSPEEIARFMWRNFRYEQDRTHFGKEDRWQSPEELLASRQGDCEDFSLFAHEILKRQGIKSFVLNVYGNGTGHSVCVFKEGSRYQVIDGSTSDMYDAASLEEIFAHIYPFWKKAAIVGFSQSTGRGMIIKLFERKD